MKLSSLPEAPGPLPTVKSGLYGDVKVRIRYIRRLLYSAHDFDRGIYTTAMASLCALTDVAIETRLLRQQRLMSL
ncbi:hypothetical protein DPMN_132630 [Dreissena polymorpha]|uniref:Uncharacterized protein n=1 Tax=Dreissena polymorpha TaxID=45954 RepID=A0A9D4FU71_DREPO|nr:hypothetical protein DPMN_132630 [Dreissena polymorpha]